MKTFGYMIKSLIWTIVILGASTQTSQAACSAGEVEVAIDVVTDAYGYELYWELVPTTNTCGTGTIFAGGNTLVGCAGGCLQAQQPGGYANSTTTTEGPWCLPIGTDYDIIFVDDWGDGGTTFNVYMDGALIYTFIANTSGCNETFTFTTTSAPDDNLTLDAGFYNTYSDSTYMRYYTQIPQQQSQGASLTFGGGISNNGILTQSSTIFQTDITGAMTYSGTSSSITLLPGNSASLDITTPFTPSAIGTYNVGFSTSSSSTDDVPSDNTIAESFTVTDTIFARDNGLAPSAYWYGAATLYFVGHNFEIYATDTATSISTYIGSMNSAGDQYNYHIWNAARTTILATATHTITSGELNSWVTLGFDAGPLPLTPATYFVGVESFSDTATYQVDGTIGAPGVGWGDMNKDGVWTANNQTLMIRLNLNPAAGGGGGCTLTSSATSISVTCNGDTDGSATAALTGGTSPYTYAWSTGGTSATVNGLIAGTYTITITDAAACVSTSSTVVTEPPVFITTASGTNPSGCGVPDGLAVASTSGGISPYTYLWDDPSVQSTMVATGLAAGMYTIMVFDMNGCISSASVTISDPGGPSLTVSGTDPTGCGTSNGTATANVTGGTSPYTYTWSSGGNGATESNLGAGTYTVTITDAGGCSTNGSTTLNSSGTAPTLSISSTDPTGCGTSNGTATANVTGGTSPYTYAWSSGGNGATESNLGAGTYTVTITDAAGCSTNGSTTLNSSGTAPTLTTSSVDPSGCGFNDGIASVNATGGSTPYTYAWSSGGNASSEINLGAGTYTVTVTDGGGCTATSSVTLSASGAPTLTTSSTNPTSCGSSDGTATVTASGGMSPYFYQWDDLSFQTTATAFGLSAGTYSVTVTDFAACQVVTQVTLTAGSAPTVSASGTNPTSCGATDGTATVTVTGGATPYTYFWSSGGNAATITNLSAGTYTVTVTDAGGCTATSTTTLTSGSAPTVSASGTNPSSCGSTDGTATASVSGGATPYTYAWSSGGNAATESNLDAGVYTVTVTDANGCSASSSTTLTSAGAPTLTTSTTDANCASNTGSASVFPSGGTAPYTYQWSNGQSGAIASGIGAGTYTVTVTDNNGCGAITTAVVTMSGTGPVLSFITSDLNCYKDGSGSAACSATGGASPYTYLWNTGETTSIVVGMNAGSYNVIVADNNGCETTQSITLIEPSEIVTISTVSDATCGASDGVASLSTVGGVPPYSYQWSASAGSQTSAVALGLSAGIYSVTTTDGNGCQMPTQVNVSNFGAPALTLLGADAACFNSNTGSITTIANGGIPPYTYSWSNGSSAQDLTNILAGTYTLTLTDTTGCATIQSVVIDEPNVLYGTTAYGNVSTPSSCDGSASIFPFGGTGVYTYSWDDPGAQNSATAFGLCVGTYNVTVTDANGCNFTLPVFVDSIAMGIATPKAAQSIEVYPNPTVGTVNISWDMPSEDHVTVRIFGLDGTEVHTATISQNAAYIHNVELTGFAKGLYFIQVVTSDQVITEKLILH